MGASESLLLAEGNASQKSGSDDMPPWALIIMEYSSWSERGHLMNLSKRWRYNTQNRHFYHFMCNRLSLEHGVYAPPVLPTADSWQSMFIDLFRIRNLWTGSLHSPDDLSSYNTHSHVGERFKISVYARFRPLVDAKTAIKDKNDEDDDEGKEVEVTLPLYQRLAMIKMSHNLKSNREALRVLTSEGGWFQAKWTELEDKENKKQNNKLNNTSSPSKPPQSPSKNKDSLNSFYSKQKIPEINVKKQGDKIMAAVQNVDPLTGRVVMIAPDVGLREFNYDGVLPLQSSQNYMYDTVMRRLVTDFINGFNATAIVYGQTGTFVCE